jgi:hypothetical protein
MAEAWAFEHTIDCSVSIDFAWAFWTDVKNWALDAEVNSVELKGPFAAGVRGVTNSKSSGRIEWRIAEVQPGRAIFEFPAPGALGVFVWTPTDELASLNARPSRASKRRCIPTAYAVAWRPESPLA